MTLLEFNDVALRKKDELLVRTRCREDLEALSKKLSLTSDFKDRSDVRT